MHGLGTWWQRGEGHGQFPRNVIFASLSRRLLTILLTSLIMGQSRSYRRALQPRSPSIRCSS